MTKVISVNIKYKIFEEDSSNIISNVNLHMTHAEDLVLLKGSDGLKWVISMFKNIYNELKGYTNKEEIKFSVKFDGSPSVFIWNKFPGIDGPGISIKSLFAKNPKLNFSTDDIEKNYGEQKDLAYKLKLLLPYIESLNIPDGEIWQGDFLFDKKSLIREKNYYSFHPNTIIYKVKKGTNIAKKIEKADVGVVWHTRYKGTSLEDIKASYDTKISELKENSKVFMTDPYIISVAGIITLTEEENKKFLIDINEIEENADKLYKSNVYKKMAKDEDFLSLFTTFQNSSIKLDYKHKNANDFIEKFKSYVISKYEKEKDLKKTEKGKNAVIDKMNIILDYFNYVEELSLIYDSMLKIVSIKNIFIKKLNNLNQFQNFLKTKSGKYISTGEEGFAVSDIHGNIIKLVDRYEFSKANFSPDIIKGWTKLK